MKKVIFINASMDLGFQISVVKPHCVLLVFTLKELILAGTFNFADQARDLVFCENEFPKKFLSLRFQNIFIPLSFFSDKIKRFLSEFYDEDDAGKKVFKYGEQLVSSF